MTTPAERVPLPRFTGREPCRQQPDAYFPSQYNRDRPQIRAAVLGCRACPVVAACLAWALAHPDLTEIGIWGATTPAQRAALRRTPAGRAPRPPPRVPDARSAAAPPRRQIRSDPFPCEGPC